MLKIKEETDISEVLLTCIDPFAVDEIFKEEFPQTEIKSEFEDENLIEILSGIKNLSSGENFDENSERNLPGKMDQNIKLKDCEISIHSADLIKNQVGFNLTDFICDICSKSYRSKNHLLSHIRNHLPEDNFKCDQCLKTFHCKKELIAHKNRNHSELLNFTCNDCEKVYKIQKEMKKCRESHAKKKKSSANLTKNCPICGKTMKSNSIYSHIRLVHNKEREKICQICGKALKTSYDLKVHLRQHSGERPEICENCGKTFVSYAQLYKHRKIRHMARENFECSICLKTLLSRYKLKCHMERFHCNGFDNGVRVDPETNCYHCTICSLKFVAMHKFEKHAELNDCHKYEGLARSTDGSKAMEGDLRGEFKCQECGR